MHGQSDSSLSLTHHVHGHYNYFIPFIILLPFALIHTFFSFLPHSLSSGDGAQSGGAARLGGALPPGRCYAGRAVARRQRGRQLPGLTFSCNFFTKFFLLDFFSGFPCNFFLQIFSLSKFLHLIFLSVIS